ncbi:hypothetical protein COCON_G00209640 [Conger conger]|uniref:Phospholipase B-like n=1 Tax=Conger conger TaxID=82655 RepID=A0A9Q1D113_CONCO|nr:hypothetical protein COCON_G00209640 [Conger conger]
MFLFLDKMLCLVVLCGVVMTVAGSDQLQAATVYWNATDRTVLLKQGIMDKEGGAYGYFNDTMERTGWGVLQLWAGYGKRAGSGEPPDDDQITFHLAGYLEGFLTAPEMENHYRNMYPQLIKDPKVRVKVKSWLSEQDQWTRQQSLKFKNDTLWKHASFIVAQLDGLQQGAAYWAKLNKREPLSEFAVQFLNAVGDLLDLIPTLAPETDLNHLKTHFTMPTMGHCSALIKMLPGFENLLLAHSSWYTYAATMRIYKHWDFRVKEPHTATGKMSFSSYPGFLESLDDFYILGSGLLMTQTTNSVYNASLFSQVKPQSLLAWQRVRLAHSLGHTGEQWAEIFSKHNSGTYNNQYMVVDMSRVSLGNWVADGALTVVEQIPGLVEYSDQTQALRRGYWPSYNVPFHSSIYNQSGYPEMWKEHGAMFSYDLCPRAKIFRRDQGGVSDLASLKKIMRYNNYKSDPYAEGDPCKTICCRNDLKAEKPSPGGCYDTKVTDFHMAQQFAAEVINGPTTQGGLPPFSWSKFNSTSHLGLPPTYNFPFLSMEPALGPDP